MAKYANLLEDAVKKVGFSDKCHDPVVDSERVASLEGRLAPGDAGERSVGTFGGVGDLTDTTSVQGAYEFMSGWLLNTRE